MHAPVLPSGGFRPEDGWWGILGSWEGDRGLKSLLWGKTWKKESLNIKIGHDDFDSGTIIEPRDR